VARAGPRICGDWRPGGAHCSSFHAHVAGIGHDATQYGACPRP
jgi:hypothetical protein